jgi:hypothetical protein
MEIVLLSLASHLLALYRFTPHSYNINNKRNHAGVAQAQKLWCKPAQHQ